MDTTEPIERNEPLSTTLPDQGPACEPDPDQEPEGLNETGLPGPKGRNELHVNDAIAMIRKGEAIRSATIVGRLHLRGKFEHPVQFFDVDLANLVIDGATFSGEVVFRNCRLKRPIIQRKATFEAGLSMQGSELVRAKIEDAKIHGRTNFRNSSFRGALLIQRVRFFGPVDFWETTFDGWANIKMCKLDGIADFRSICANEGFAMQTCHFGGDFLFRGATVCKKCDFSDSTFEGLVDVSKAKLHDFVYLETITMGEDARFAFWNTVAERVQIRPEQLEGRIASENEHDHKKAMCEYGLLKRNFEALHRHEEEDWAFYHFKVNERRSRPRSWRRPWSKLSQCFEWLVLDLGCRYGTSPFRTVAAAAVMIVAFSLVYMIGVTSLPLEEGKTPFEGASTTVANRVVIGLVTSVSAFTDGLGSLRETARGWMNLFLVMESLLGTLIWGLFIVAFSRKVIR